MIDIETASRSIDIVVGIALLTIVATAFLAWLYARSESKYVRQKCAKTSRIALKNCENDHYEEKIRDGAKAFMKEMELKRIIEEQNVQIVKLTSENERMRTIIERASR